MYPKNPSYWLLSLALELTLGLFGAGRLLAAGTDLPYVSGSTGADGALTFREIPGGRNSAGLAYDPVRQEAILFGGYNGSSLGDTWAWRGGPNWIHLVPANSPPDRWGHGMVWDAARQQIVLFGGTRNTGRLNDTWTWDGTNWTQRLPVTSPSARDSFCLAGDDAHQRVVLFGGSTGGAETWLWDGTNWTLMTPATSPPSTASSAMAYDPVRQQCLLFGNYGQTWIWDGNAWAQRSPLHTPSARSSPSLIADGTSNTIILFGGGNQSDTWSWNGTDWTQLAPGTFPSGRQNQMMVWDAARLLGVMFGGSVAAGDSYSADTWLWNSGNWLFWSGKLQVFDMSTRANGIWNFTTINIPSGVTVQFNKNAANSPVRWLASGDVTIDGTIDVSGEFGANELAPGIPAHGGPGGYDGGRGGIRFDASASFAGQPGQGPGGGAPGTAQQTNPVNLRDGNPGQYNGTYGNTFLQPLLGGSGGGGGSSANTANGGNGGGGGGALLLASSRDIMLNGLIRANGGDVTWSGASYGGQGSGGAILLRADRITGPGSLQAFGGQPGNPNGRIRTEAYLVTLVGSQTPAATVDLPASNGELNQQGTLSIVSVKGVNVASPPTGNLLTPDVVFSDTGPVQIAVAANGIPDGTAVQLRITTQDSVVQPAPQNLASGTVTFSVTVPKGVGTLQATAQFTQ